MVATVTAHSVAEVKAIMVYLSEINHYCEALKYFCQIYI